MQNDFNNTGTRRLIAKFVQLRRMRYRAMINRFDPTDGAWPAWRGSAAWR